MIASGNALYLFGLQILCLQKIHPNNTTIPSFGDFNSNTNITIADIKTPIATVPLQSISDKAKGKFHTQDPVD
jgi:hypothetical protein